MSYLNKPSHLWTTVGFWSPSSTKLVIVLAGMFITSKSTVSPDTTGCKSCTLSDLKHDYIVCTSHKNNCRVKNKVALSCHRVSTAQAVFSGRYFCSDYISTTTSTLHLASRQNASRWKQCNEDYSYVRC